MYNLQEVSFISLIGSYPGQVCHAIIGTFCLLLLLEESFSGVSMKTRLSQNYASSERRWSILPNC